MGHRFSSVGAPSSYNSKSFIKQGLKCHSRRPQNNVSSNYHQHANQSIYRFTSDTAPMI